MRSAGHLKRRPLGRGTVLAWSWLSAVAALLLLWFYLYGFGYGLGQQGAPGLLLDVSTDGREDASKQEGSALGSGPARTNSSTATTAAISSTRTAPSTTAAQTTSISVVMTTSKRPNGTSAREPAVVLRQGTYVGTTLLASHRFPKALEAFRGVPYAQDTGGNNRFRPPQPLPESNETFDAVESGKICPAEGVVRRNMSENCLNAEIYRPAGLVDRHGYEKAAGAAAKKMAQLPVVVYVHGGGFNVGHGTERNMASFVAWAEEPMVAVSFNYRVGPLGFLPSEVTAREGLLNLGLRDQQMLFDWVQDNIAAFGGDPRNVTVMGLSAGAHSIGHHIMYYSRNATEAPFIKAILESGATTARAVYYPTHPRHLVQYREFLVAAGAAGVPESDIIPHLRKLPLETLVRASKSVWDKYIASVGWPFQPVIDGPNPFANSSRPQPNTTTLPPIIPTLPLTSWQNHSHLRLPIITGFNTNEGTAFIPPHASTNDQFLSFFRTLIPSLSKSDLDVLQTLYPDPVTDPSPNNPYTTVPKGMGKQWARLDAAYAHYAYICPVLQTAHFMSLSGVKEVYVYRYAATAAHGTANHADETPVVARDVEELRGMPGLREVARVMHGWWAGFVSGDGSLRRMSNGGGGEREGKGEEVEWPAFVSPFVEGEGGKKGEGKIMVFGEGNDERGGGRSRGVPARVVKMTELEKEACRFWWERVPLSEGLGRREGDGKAGARL